MNASILEDTVASMRWVGVDQLSDEGRPCRLEWGKGGSECRGALPLGDWGDPSRLEPAEAEELVRSESRNYADLIEACIRGGSR